jgi:apolipoprotein N-acyltransferase
MNTRKILCAILSGVMLTASFPPGKLDWMAWFALLPLLKSLENEAPSRAFRLGLISGLAHYATLVYWVVVVLKRYGGLSIFICISALVLLCFYLSLYPAIFSYLICYYGVKTRLMIFLVPSLWVSLEYVRAKALTGFPWCLLGYSQFRHITLIQIVDLIGVYGISFLIVLSNILAYFVFFKHNLKGRKFLKWEVLVLLLIVFFTWVYGHQRLAGVKAKSEDRKSLRTAIIQGNIDQSVKWNPQYQTRTLDIYHRLTRSTDDFNPQLVIWPETAVPFFVQNNIEFSLKLFDIAKESGSDLIFGSPAYKRKDNRIRYYNRAYHLSPDTGLSGFYDKVHLVPFGEYVPLKTFFPFIHRLVPAAGDFASGEKIAPLKLPYASAGILICFEAIFPELARLQVREGTDILINLTNDAWFGMTSAPYQHLSMAIFRAVENGRPVIRAANTGFSAFISPQGKVITRSGLFAEEILKHELELDGSKMKIYTRYGDFFACSLFIINLIKFLHVLYYGFKSRKEVKNVRRSNRKN